MTWLGSSPTLLVIGTVVLALLAASPAGAQANRNSEARVYFEQGNRHLAQAMQSRGARRTRLLQQALDSYVDSLNIVRSRNVVFNAALTLQELGRHDEAFAYYTEYLRMRGLSDEERAEADRRRNALREHVAVVAVESEPEGAEVRVDRRDLAPRGRTPLEVALSPGHHTFHLSLDGYEEKSVTATASTGERITVGARLAPLPVPVVIRAPRVGNLTIDGRPVQPGQQIDLLPGRHIIRYDPAIERVIELHPGSELRVVDLDVPDQPRGRGRLVVVADTPVQVTVDGGVVGEGIQVEAAVGSGRHMVEVRAVGYATTRSEIDVQPGETTTLDVHMEPRVSGSTLGHLPLVTWVATGVVAAAAVAFTVNAFRLNGEFEENPPTTATSEKADAVDEANLVADLVWGATGLLAVTAILLTILDRDLPQPRSTIQIGAAPLPQGGMVTAALRWGTP